MNGCGGRGGIVQKKNDLKDLDFSCTHPFLIIINQKSKKCYTHMQTIIEFPVVPANRSRTQIVVYVGLAFTYYVSPPATLI